MIKTTARRDGHPVFSVAQPCNLSRSLQILPLRQCSKPKSDEYTRYELLAPETASFKIRYEVTATTARCQGVLLIRSARGSTASDEAVYDAHDRRASAASKSVSGAEGPARTR